MKYSSNKEVHLIVKDAVDRGCKVISGGKHIKILFPDGVTVVVVSRTPRNVSSLEHVGRCLKRAGL